MAKQANRWYGAYQRIEMFRTDLNNNPAAFTTDVAHEAGLVIHTDYEIGDSFSWGNVKLYTAKLLGDPVAVTIRVIDKIGFRTRANGQRWDYISIPKFLWDKLDLDTKRDVIGYMYQNEGGTEMRKLFPRTFK